MFFRKDELCVWSFILHFRIVIMVALFTIKNMFVVYAIKKSFIKLIDPL